MPFAIDSKRWNDVVRLTDRLVAEGQFPAVSLCAGVAEGTEVRHAVGRFEPNRADDPREVSADSPFLVASITKPVTVTAVMMLAERGLVGLDDPLVQHVPEFQGPGKEKIRIRHLMSHTSGLPDMLPNNDALRAAHTPFDEFVKHICRCELLFEPGTQVSYQSMGTAMLAEVVHQADGRTIGDFLKAEIFDPLGMRSTALGVSGEAADKVVRIDLTPEQSATDWNWNTPYWHGFGAPWGGMTTTTADLGRLARLFLNGGAIGRFRALSDTSVSLMTTSRMDSFPKLSDDDRRFRTWGLGWRVVGAGVATHLGELLSPETYGHYGATGTQMWIDPVRRAYAVILTNRAFERTEPRMMRLSNAISAAIVNT